MRKKIREVSCETEKKQLINQFANNATFEQVNFLTANQYARNSLLAMTKDWNLFIDFCKSKSVSPLPASSTAVRLFIEKEAAQRKYATVKRYVVTISLFHRILRLSDPTASSGVKLAVAKLRLDKKGDANATVAFAREHLDELTNLLTGSKHPRDIRNLAMYHLMFEGMLKRSELRDLTISDLDERNDTFFLNIGEQSIALSSQAQSCLSKWLAVRTATSWLFSAIDKHGNISENRLDDSSIYRALRYASDVLDLPVKFSGQSLRVGAAKELAKAGVKVRDIQQRGRWLSAAMPYQYIGNKAMADIERMVFKRFKPIS